MIVGQVLDSISVKFLRQYLMEYKPSLNRHFKKEHYAIIVSTYHTIINLTQGNNKIKTAANKQINITLSAFAGHLLSDANNKAVSFSYLTKSNEKVSRIMISEGFLKSSDLIGQMLSGYDIQCMYMFIFWYVLQVSVINIQMDVSYAS